MTRVVAANHPLRTAVIDTLVPEGLTLDEVLSAVQPDPVLRAHAVMYIGDQVVDREHWHLVRPKDGHVVTVRVLPMGSGGGGKSPLRTVLTVAVIAAAFTFGGPLGGSLVGAGVVNAGLAVGLTVGQGIALTTALGSALITVGGTLVVNALAPVRPASIGTLSGAGSGSTAAAASPTLFIEGARNAGRPFGVIPSVLGVHREVPPLGATSFTEVVGDDQFLRVLVVWGYGPLKIENIKVGETPIAEFDGVQIETNEGRAGDSAFTLFPNSVNEDNFSILLTQAADWVQRTSGPDADELSVDLSFNRGLVSFSPETGQPGSRSVVAQIEYRKVGDVPWLTPIFSHSTVDESAISGNQVTFENSTSSAIRHGLRWPVALRGQYEIRVRRVTVESSRSTVFDELTFSAIRAITDEDPLNFKHELAATALVIKATGQLNNVVDELNAEVSSYVLDWNGAAWVEAVSSNPASLFRHVLQGNANDGAVADARVDLAKLQTWHDDNVINGSEFNMIRDFPSSVWDTLLDVAVAGRASPTQIDGKWSVVQDKPQSVPVQHFTPRNSYSFDAEKVFLKPLHALRVRFINRDEGWRNDEIIVYDDGFDVSNATNFATLDVPGVTDADHAWKIGRFQLAQSRLRPERWTLAVDFESLVARRGDLVVITHDTLLVGLASGRIIALQDDGGGNTTGFTSDEILTMDGVQTYGVAVRTVSNNEFIAEVVSDVGDQTTVVLASPIAAASGPQAGDLFGFGTLGLETIEGILLSIEPKSDLAARLVMIPASPAIHTSDTGSIPTFETQLSPLPVVPDAVVVSVRSDESILTLGAGNTLVPRIAIQVQPVQSRVLSLDIEIRATGSTEPYRDASVVQVQGNDYIIGEVVEKSSYDLRVRWNDENRLPNLNWSSIPGHKVVGQTSPPAELANLTISAFGGSALLRWDRPEELDVRFGGTVKFRHTTNTDVSTAEWSESVSIGDVSQSEDLVAQLPLKSGTYLARVFDKGSRPSVNVSKVSTKQASVLEFASVSSLTEDPGFSGTKTNVVVASSNLTLAGGSLFDTIADFDLVTDLDVFGGIQLIGTYEFSAGIDITTVRRVRVTTDLDVLIVNVLDQIDQRSELIDTWEDFDGIDQAVADARIQERHTDDDPAGSPTWTPWNNIESAEFTARGFEFRILLETTDPAFNIRVSALSVTVEDVV